VNKNDAPPRTGDKMRNLGALIFTNAKSCSLDSEKILVQIFVTGSATPIEKSVHIYDKDLD